MAAPLKDIRVLDMSRILAGPWAGQLLGDYGADVVKVERPGPGDDTRHWGPPWYDGQSENQSAYFLSTNRNKRSITVDIASGPGRELVRELTAATDVLLENYKVGTLQRYGLGWDDLRTVNPGLIYCSISAFGQSGARASEPGYDAMIQASGGLMSITGPEGHGGPQKVGVAIADIMAGMYAVTAILAALNARQLSGSGQHIDIPLYDTQVAWLANQNMNFLVGGRVPGRMGTAHPNLAPYQAFATLDGSLMLAVGNDQQFANCVRCLGLPELASDERFTRNQDRVANRDALVDLLQDAIRKRSTNDWLSRFGEINVPAGPINDIEAVLTNAHAQERKLVRELNDARGDPVPTVANPVAFSESPVTYDKAPPMLGEHTDEVLREWLGYSDAQIADLRRSKAI